jgi:ribosomal protein L31E
MRTKKSSTTVYALKATLSCKYGTNDVIFTTDINCKVKDKSVRIAHAKQKKKDIYNNPNQELP